MFIGTDANMIEVNPLILTKEKKIICLDAKVNLDSNALLKHPEKTNSIFPTQIKFKIGNLNKFLIFIISFLFLYLFYLEYESESASGLFLRGDFMIKKLSLTNLFHFSALQLENLEMFITLGTCFRISNPGQRQKSSTRNFRHESRLSTVIMIGLHQKNEVKAGHC